MVIHHFFVLFYSGACWSSVGKVGGGEQKLSLGQRCWYLGIVIHELGHSVGFWHEMNRPDRNDWIYIHWNNIIEVTAAIYNLLLIFYIFHQHKQYTTEILSS